MNYSEWIKVLGVWGWIPLGLTAVQLALKLWTGFHSARIGLSVRRTKRLYALALKDRWHSAPPIALEMAVSDVLHVTLDGRAIRLAFERCRVMELLRDLKKVGGMVRIRADRNGFEVAGHKFRSSYRAHAIAMYLITMLPYAGFMITARLFAQPAHAFAWMTGFIGFLAWMCFGVYLASTFEAAHRLVEAFDQWYPRATAVNGSAAKRSPQVKAKSRLTHERA